ncbi:MAG: hypothetical protein IPI67_39095 [Myxococcales bacterium]|nr:hypothetical protein [Myxococcales bacterium]
MTSAVWLRRILALLALVFFAAAANGQSYQKAYDENVEPVVGVVTHEGTGEALDVMQKSVERAKQVQDDLKAGVETALQTRSGAAKKLGKKLVEESKGVSAEYAKEISWLDKLKKLAQIIDIVSTGAKVAGNLAEGDTQGAKHALVDDVCKKVCAAGGAAALSWIPGVGSIAGAAGGEEAYKKYLKPLLDKRDQELREKAAKDAQLDQWVPREQVIDSQGKVRELERDMYFDPASGLIKRRPPQEQEKWEAQKKREFFDGRKLDAIHKDYLAGKLPRSEFDKALSDFKKRDPLAVWEPPKLEYTAAPAGSAGATRGILERVKPQQVSASGGDSSGTLTITFWNVGALAQGYGDASAVTRHRNGVETVSGTFSGGPNGTLSFVVDGEKTSMHLSGGKTLTGPYGSLPVKNPQAFDGWPDEL